MIHAEEIANPDKCLILLPLIKAQNSVMRVSDIYTCLLLSEHAHFKYSLRVIYCLQPTPNLFNEDTSFHLLSVLHVLIAATSQQ